MSSTGKVTIAACRGEAGVTAEGGKEDRGEWGPNMLRPCPHALGPMAAAREGPCPLPQQQQLQQ